MTGVMGCRCNITLEVNHLTEGIRLGLQDDREKNSDALGRLALFKVCTLLEPHNFSFLLAAALLGDIYCKSFITV